MTRFTAFALQSFSLAMLLACPWWYGSVDWQVQQWIFAAGLVLAVLMAIHVGIASRAREENVAPEGLPWLLLALGCFAILQCQPQFAWQPSGVYSPPSVQMQRWALGLAPPPSSISEGLIEPMVANGKESTGIPCNLEGVPERERFLALSIEPNTTRAAAGSLFLAALLVWVGSTVFCGRRAFPILLIAMTVLGSLVGLYGIINIVAPSTRAWLDLERANSFAMFVSKNSAGAFLNVAFAGALGFVMWGVQRGVRNPVERHRHGRRTLVALAAKPWQRYLARLDSVQIASIVALVLIGAALLQTLSRGAMVAGLAATLMAIVVTLRGERSPLAIAGGLMIAAFTIGFVILFQLDERVLTRLESLGELDIESDSRSGRLYIWDVSWQAAQFYSWLGSGLGTFQFASLPFQRPSFPVWHYHAESIYWESMVTLGYLGFGVIVIAIGLAYRGLRSIYVSDRFRDFTPIQAAGIYVLVSQTIHSAVDFALILPGVYIPASLLMGAALGAKGESRRVVRKLKERSTSSAIGPTKDLPEQPHRPTRALVMALGMMILCMLGLHYGRQAAIPLAIAESSEREFTRMDRLPIEERGDDRLRSLVDTIAENRVTIDDSPQLLQLVADCLFHDDRMQRWKLRSANAEPKLAWNETSHFLIRMAYDRTDPTERDAWVDSIGGEERLERFRNASRLYARARARSPLDWRPLWGTLYTSLDCTATDSALFIPVLQRTSSHLPQRLTSASIFFNNILSENAKFNLWAIAMQSSPDASMGIGRIMATQYADGSVPVNIFPTNVNYLYKLAREVFTRTAFPQTHQLLCERAIDAIPSIRILESYRSAKLLADVANEAGNTPLEIDSLRKHLRWKVDDESSLVRLINLEIKEERWNEAADSLHKLRQINATHPSISRLTDEIQRQSPER